jgi:transcriptional antiterminator Rof (Rho-off)
MSTASDYEPVACGFYDELGLRMMRGTPSRLVIEGQNRRETRKAVIDDLYTEGDAEYVRLSGGRTIRLDRIVQVDDVDRNTR